MTVNYATQNFQAVAPGDFTATSGTLTFTPGTTSQPVDVTVIDDTMDENNEDFIVNISSPVNAGLSNTQAFCTITDNDPTPSMSISDASVTETDSGTVTMVFTVTLSAASGKTPVSAMCYQQRHSHLSRRLHIKLRDYVDFSTGKQSQTINITVNSDTLDENDETFNVTLTNPPTPPSATAARVGTILDNDPTPTLSINDVTSASETGAIQFTVSLSAVSGRTVTVNYATSNGTATAGGDYISAVRNANFQPRPGDSNDQRDHPDRYPTMNTTKPST